MVMVDVWVDGWLWVDVHFVWILCGGADLVCAQSDFLVNWYARRTPAFSRWELMCIVFLLIRRVQCNKNHVQSPRIDLWAVI